jgi:hypothetical protein
VRATLGIAASASARVSGTAEAVASASANSTGSCLGARPVTLISTMRDGALAVGGNAIHHDLRRLDGELALARVVSPTLGAEHQEAIEPRPVVERIDVSARRVRHHGFAGPRRALPVSLPAQDLQDVLHRYLFMRPRAAGGSADDDRATPRPRRSFPSAVGRCLWARSSCPFVTNGGRGHGLDWDTAFPPTTALPLSYGVATARSRTWDLRFINNPIASARADLSGHGSGEGTRLEVNLRLPAQRGGGFYARLRRATIRKTLRRLNTAMLWHANHSAVW